MSEQAGTLGERHLRRALSEYVEHYHRERNHQGIGNRLLVPAARAFRPANGNQPIECHERLNGLLNFYYRRAACPGIRNLAHADILHR